MIRFYVDGSSRWEYAVDDSHLNQKLRGRAATVIRPLSGLRYWLNALRGLLGLEYNTFDIERRRGDI